MSGKGKGKGEEGENEEWSSVERKGKKKVKDDDRNYLSPACYTLSRDEMRIFCKSLYNIKAPAGYSSNMKRFVTLDGKLRLSSMKSHDCHVIMQVFLSIQI